jgi:hypothetical protein
VCEIYRTLCEIARNAVTIDDLERQAVIRVLDANRLVRQQA